MKINCWEFKKCGREPGGDNADKLGICPATIETKVDGINSGKNGGRCCWTVAGTICSSQIEGTFSAKLKNCLKCDFYKLVYSEEKDGSAYKKPLEIFNILNSSHKK